MPEIIQERKIIFGNKDPIAHFFGETLKLTPLNFGILILFADLIVDTFLGWNYHAFFSIGQTPGILQDSAALITDFIINPLVCGAFLWAYHWSEELFTRLHRDGIFENEDRIRQVELRRNSLYKSHFVFILVTIFSLLVTFAQVASYKQWVPWRTIEGYLYLSHGNMSFFRMPFWFLTLYGIIYILINMAINVYCIYLIFKNQKVNLKLKHPDGCGGLSCLAEYAFTGVTLIVPIGALISVSIITATIQQTLSSAYPVWFAFLGYLIFAPVLLITPLLSAHWAMVKTKNYELENLAKAYDKEYQLIYRSLINDPLINSQNHAYDDLDTKMNDSFPLKKLDNIKSLYQTVEEDFPTWPINMRLVRRYIAAVATPLIPAIISIILDLILKNMLKTP